MKVGLIFNWILLLFLGFNVSGQIRGKEPIKIPFHYSQSFIIIEVKIDQTLPLRLIFDTGAEHNVIFNMAYFESFTNIYSREIKVFGSDLKTEIPALLTKPMEVFIPQFELVKMPFIVLKENVGHLEQIIGESVHGLISAHIFTNYLVEINYKKSIIYLHPQSLKEKIVKNYEEIKIDVNKNKPYLKTELSFSENTRTLLTLLIDTGAGLPLLIYSNTDSSISLPPKVILGQLGSGLGGMINGSVGQINGMKFGSANLHGIFTYFQEVDKESLIKETIFKQGIIGNQILDRYTVIFDFIGERVYLKPRKNLYKPFHFDKSGLTFLSSGYNLNRFYVSNVISGSTADMAGIKIGDQLIRLGFIPATMHSISSISRKLQKPEGTKIQMVMKRDNKKFKVQFVLKNLF